MLLNGRGGLPKGAHKVPRTRQTLVLKFGGDINLPLESHSHEHRLS